MINEFTFSAISPLAMALKAANKRIVAEKNSPVELLNRASNTPLFTNGTISDTEFFQSYPTSLNRDVITGDTEVVEYSVDGKAFKDIPVAQHETTLGELKNEMSEAVLDLISFCRGVVHPAIEAIFERFEDPQHVSSKELWSLVPIPAPEFLDSDVFQSILAKVPQGTLDKSVRSYAPKLIPQDLEIGKTGHSVYDKTIAELLESLGTTPNKLLNDVWTKDIGLPSQIGAWEKVATVAATLMLLLYFKDNPWEDSGLSLFNWESSFETEIIKAGQWLRGYLETTVFRIDNGLLVASYDEQNRRVYLYEEVWNKYLEEGGAVESLHGALCRAETDQSYEIKSSTLFEDAAENIRTWESFHAVNEASSTMEWVQTTRSRLIEAVCQWVDSVEDDTIFADSAWRNRAREEVRSHVTLTLQVSDMKDATAYLIDLLFHTAFKHVDGRIFMLDIHNLVKDGTPVKNATYFAMRKYLESYVFYGLQVE